MVRELGNMLSVHLQHIRGNAFTTPVLAVYLAVGITFAGNILFARAIGAEVFGLVSLVVVWALLLSSLGQLGQPTLLLRKLTASDVSKNPGTISPEESFSVMLLWICLASIPVFATISNSDTTLESLSGLQNFSVLLLLALAIATIRLSAMVVRAQGQTSSAILMERIWRPATYTIGAVAIFSGVFAVEASNLVIFLAAISVLYAVLCLFKAGVRPWQAYVGAEQLKSLSRQGFPFWLSNLAGTIMKRSDVILMAYFVDPIAVGLYVIANRLAELPTVSSAAIITILGPRFSRQAAGAGHKVQGEAQWRSVKQGLLLSAMLGLPTALIIVVFAPFLLGLAGAEFGEAKIALFFLLIPAFLMIPAKPLVTYLNMSGAQNVVARIKSIALPCHLALFAAMVWSYGLEGGAAARAAVQVILHAILIVIAYSRLKKHRKQERKNIENF